MKDSQFAYNVYMTCVTLIDFRDYIAVADVLILFLRPVYFLILMIRETTWSAVGWILSDFVENKEALLVVTLHM